MKISFYLKKILVWFFGLFIHKPARAFLRVFFYKVVVRIYGAYLSILSKMGWKDLRGNFFKFLFNQKLVHVLVIVLTFFSVFANLVTKTNANDQVTNMSDTILAQLVKGEFNDLPDDQQLIVETFDSEATISATHQSYLDSLSGFRPQPKVTENDEVNGDEMLTDQNTGSIIHRDSVSTQISKKAREKIISYTVKTGDTISTIAEEFDISASSILWENNLTAYSIIRPGNTLDILPVSGVSHVVKKGENITQLAVKYKVSESEITTFNKLNSSGMLILDQKIIIPGGRPVEEKVYVPKTYSGLAVIKDFIKEPSRGESLTKDTTDESDAAPLKGNKMNWPTVGNRISQYYSWRHHAVDIANKIGTPLYAADAGVVEEAGWGTGYGNQIVIDHGGGKKTRYAHCSKFYVEKGEKVSKGQTIAAMGSTGWSTGSHIHFEVIINGIKYNPLNYIK